MEKQKVLAVIRKINVRSSSPLVAAYTMRLTKKEHMIVKGTNHVKEISRETALKYNPAIAYLDSHSSFEYQIVCTDMSQNELREQALKEVAFWKKHPQIANVKNPNNVQRGDANWDSIFYNENSIGVPEFLIEVFDEVEEEDTTRFVNQVKAISRYYNLPFEVKKNIAYYFNVNPSNLSEKALMIKMIGIDNKGVLFCDDEATKSSNLDVFLRTFGEGGKASFDVETEILAHKALEANKIVNRAGMYYVGTEVIATDFKGVVLYLKDNPKYRDILAADLEPKEEVSEKGSKRGRKATEEVEA